MNKQPSVAEARAESALSSAAAVLGDRGEGVGAECPDDDLEHAGDRTIIL